MVFPLAVALLTVQPVGSPFDSLELMVASCDTILRAPLESIAPSAREGFDAVNVRASEFFKGRAAPGGSISFLVRRFDKTKTLERWRARRTPLLLFLDRRNRPAGLSADGLGTHTLRSGELERSVLTLDRFPATQTYATDLTPLRGGESILPRVRTAIRDVPPSGEIEIHTISVRFLRQYRAANSLPRDATGHLPLGSYPIVRVPADARLERLARAWTFSRDPGFREVGALALAPFRSPENARRLRLLLRDTYRQRATDGYQEFGSFSVREAAKGTLKGWGETP